MDKERTSTFFFEYRELPGIISPLAAIFTFSFRWRALPSSGLPDSYVLLRLRWHLSSDILGGTRYQVYDIARNFAIFRSYVTFNTQIMTLNICRAEPLAGYLLLCGFGVEGIPRWVCTSGPHGRSEDPLVALNLCEKNAVFI